MRLFKSFRMALLGAASISGMSAALASTIANNTTGITSTTTDSTQTITQTTARGVINWTDLSVTAGSSLIFNQPSKDAITLNRVIGLGGDITPTKIDGTLSANGQVWILNPTGVLIGSTGVVNVGGLLASTLDLTEQAFDVANETKTDFSLTGTSTASVVNNGSITAANSGYAVLAGSRVENKGLIQANLGTVALGSGQALTMSFSGDKLISFLVPTASGVATGSSIGAGSVDLGIMNDSTGKLIADGGRVLVTAGVAANTAAGTINVKGLVQARSASNQNGEIVLDAGLDGSVVVEGKLDANGLSSGERGGTINVTGQSVSIKSDGSLLARGMTGGGQITMGRGPITGATSTTTTLSALSGSTFDASAVQTGAGGTITLLSDYNDPASFIAANGTFYADGGSSSGAGGTISAFFSKIDLSNSSGSLSVRPGQAAKLVFNSNSLEISPTAGGVGQLAQSDIESILGAGRTLTLNAIGDTATTGSIAINSGISKTLAGNSLLTFSAKKNIILNSGANISSSAGSLNISFNSDTDLNGSGSTRLAGNINIMGSGFKDGLIGIKYEGYYNDNYSFFANAVPENDPRFALPFTSINGTTPGRDFDDTYSVKFSGYFKPSITGVYFFGTQSDDASHVFLGSAGQSVNLLQQQVIQNQAPAPLVNNGGVHEIVFREGMTGTLTAGSYSPIVLLFGENGGGDFISLFHAAGGTSYSDNGLGFYFHEGQRSNINFSGAVELLSNVNLTTTGDVIFSSSLDSSAGSNSHALNVNANEGAVKFLNPIGSIARLSNLTVSASLLEAGTITLINDAAHNDLGIATINVANGSSVFGNLTSGMLVKEGVGSLDLFGENVVSRVAINGGELGILNPSVSAISSANSIQISAASSLNLFDSLSPGITLVKSLSGSGQVQLGAGKSLDITSGLAVDVFSGKIIGDSQSTLTVSGGQFSVAGDLDFSGNVKVGAATLKLTASGSLADASSLRFEGSNGGILDLTGLASSTTVISNFGTDLPSRSGTVRLGDKVLVIDTRLGFAGVNGLSLEGSGSLDKQGPGKLSLTGLNSYTGPTRVGGGILEIGSETQLGTGSIVLAGGTLRFLSSGAVSLTKPVSLVADSSIEFQTIPSSYKVSWSGAQFNNSARAIGFFDADPLTFSTLLGAQQVLQVNAASDAITIRDLTVTGSSSGNGVFSDADFGSYVFQAAGPLDFSKELIGQLMSNGKYFGSFTDGYGGASGDFNLFRSNVLAPNGTFYFVLTTSGFRNNDLRSKCKGQRKRKYKSSCASTLH